MAVTYADIVGAVNSRLAGLANAFTADQIQSFVNEGKDELWKALANNSDDYFLQSTTTTASQSNTFAALNTTTREYTLPIDCLRPRFIEVLAPSGYEKVEFLWRKIHHPDFADQRRQATADGPTPSNSFISIPQVYYYTIVGKNTFMLARYPEVAFNLKVWYVRSLPDLAQGSSLDETVAPFKNDIVNFAVKRCQTLKDPASFALWLGEWRSSIVGTVQAAGPRSDSNAIFVAEAEY